MNSQSSHQSLPADVTRRCQTAGLGWVLTILILLAAPGYAATWSWSGGGATGNWSDSANWGYAGVPANGDTLIFSAAQPRLANTNNLAGLVVNQLRFVGAGGGYAITGNSFTLTNGIVATNTAGVNTIGNAITLAIIDQPINVGSGASLTLSGGLNGSVGVTKSGAGTLTYAGSVGNFYTGPTLVNGGLLQLNNSYIGIGYGSLTITNATVRELLDYQLEAIPVTVQAGGVFDLNGNYDTIGNSLTLSGGGSVNTGTGGTLALNPGAVAITNLSGSGAINGSGYLQLNSGPCTIYVASGRSLAMYPIVQGSAAITKAGQGSLYFRGANSYTGQTSVSQGSLYAENSLALGTTNGATVVSSGATLVLDGGINIKNEALTLNGPGINSVWGSLDVESGINTWAGPITNSADSTFDAWNVGSELHISGPISGPGGLELFGSGTHFYEGTAGNFYSGATTVDAGTTLVLNKGADWGAVPASLVIDGTVRCLGSYQLFYLSSVTINNGGLFNLNGYSAYIGTLSGGSLSTLALGSGYFYVDYGASGTSTFGGLITGSGTLNKQYSATLILNNNNTYTGPTIISSGSLVINGSQPQSPVTVAGGGTLAGSGTVGIIAANGIISPGNSPGMLTSSNVTFTASGNLTVELRGPTPGTDYDQLNIRGTNSLASATLTILPTFLTPVALGQQFTIINNDGSDPITGAFNGRAEGSTIIVGGYKFTISYHGGTGNDVVLTLTSIPGAAVSSTVTAGNGSHSVDPDGCNNLDLTITNQTASAMAGISATLSTTTEGVIITQPYAMYPDIPAYGTGTNVTPFQISTLPNFTCGNPINLQLSVISSLGAFTMSYVLNTGESAAPVRYDNNVLTNVPDIGTIESINNVASWPGGPVNKVTVSLWLVAPFSSDVSLSLIAPDGTTVPLASGVGSGANFGTGSADASRTTFDDAAATAITAGASPFAGTFRPQSPLSAFVGVWPAGNWRLRVQDSYGSGSPDTLRGWSLFLYGTTCSPGSGICDVCLPPIAGAIAASDPVQTNRWLRDGIVSSYGSPKGWTGFGDVGPNFHYDVYTFTNTSSADASVSVQLESTNDVMASLYLNSYDATTISNNFLGDAGDSTTSYGGVSTFSSRVPPGARFLVVVNEVVQASGTQPYTLTLSGLPCPPPMLNIDPVETNKACLYWDTSAGGYVLESACDLTATAWGAVTNEPLISGGNYIVTNSCVPLSNQFYRLRKVSP